ncbi:MAG: hypothetical protein IK025_11965 [Bacteroidales bacterium]|nr:hypothetical protein [Bacteroidales bacterium]
MRKLIGLLIMLLPVVVFSQKVVNGFGIEAFMGKTYNSSENIKFRYNNADFEANMTGESEVFGGSAYFPFDMGIKRHRFTLAIGLEYRMAKVNLGANREIVGSDGIVKEDIALKLTSYSPLVQALYRPHFYLGRIHMSFSIGANFKYAVFAPLEICDKSNETLIDYDASKTESDDGFINFNSNFSAERMSNYKFHIDPRMGFDFYIGNSLVISLFAIVPDVSSAVATTSIKLEYGAGLTYLIRTNKITEAKILQQYKK